MNTVTGEQIQRFQNELRLTCGNIMIGTDSLEPYSVKLLDFGIAKNI